MSCSKWISTRPKHVLIPKRCFRRNLRWPRRTANSPTTLKNPGHWKPREPPFKPGSTFSPLAPATRLQRDNTRRALDDANRQLAQQKELAARLASEKETLQQRLNGLSATTKPPTCCAWRIKILKKQLADLRAAGPSPGKADEASRQLAQAQVQIATLQSDKELLRMEKLVLENKVRKLSTATATAAPQGILFDDRFHCPARAGSRAGHSAD